VEAIRAVGVWLRLRELSGSSLRWNPGTYRTPLPRLSIGDDPATSRPASTQDPCSGPAASGV